MISYKLKRLKITQYIARNAALAAPLPSNPSVSFSRPPLASVSGSSRANRSSRCYPSLYVATKAAPTPGCEPLTVFPGPSTSSLLVSLFLSIPILPSVTPGPFSVLSIPATESANSNSGDRTLTTASLGREAICQTILLWTQQVSRP